MNMRTIWTATLFTICITTLPWIPVTFAQPQPQAADMLKKFQKGCRAAVVRGNALLHSLQRLSYSRKPRHL